MQGSLGVGAGERLVSREVWDALGVSREARRISIVPIDKHSPPSIVADIDGNPAACDFVKKGLGELIVYETVHCFVCCFVS